MLLADKIRELPAEKIVPFVKRQLATGRVQPVLGLFPQITRDYPDLAPALEAIHQRALAKEAMLSETQPTGMDVSQTHCPGCSAVLHRAREDARAVACSYCGTRFEPDNADATAVQLFDPESFRPRSFLRLGMVGRIGDQPCQVVGRMVWDGVCREWDSEDKTWEQTPWQYEEWLLLTENRHFRYLCHDSEGLSVSREFTPTQPNLPGQSDRKMTLENGARARKVSEHGTYDLHYFEGEFGWVPQVGEQVRTSEYDRGSETLSAEARINPESGDVQEVEFFRSEVLPPRDLLEAFDRRSELAELDRRRHVNGQYARWRWASFATAALLAVLGFFMARPGSQVFFDSFTFEEISTDGALAGPIELSAVDQPHSLTLTANFKDNSWAWVGAELLDSEQNSINAIPGDFWRESGYDDGAWSESNLRADRYFRLTEPGTYYVRLQLEKGTAGEGNVGVGVHEKTVLWRYYLVCAVLAMAMGLLLMRKVHYDDLIQGRIAKP